MEKVRKISIAAIGKLEDDIVTAIARAQTLAVRSGLAFKWTTNQLSMCRAVGGNHPGAAQMALHSIEIRAAWGGVEASEAGVSVINGLDAIITLQNNITGAQTDAVITYLSSGRAIASEWCVAWTSEELGQAVHAPMGKNRMYNAFMGMQPLADRFGAKASPVETGVAVIGCAPAIADAVLQGWPQPEGTAETFHVRIERTATTKRT